MAEFRRVYIISLDKEAILLNLGAYASKVQYEDNGMTWAVFIDNDDLIVLEDYE